jgi:hypothetical protein
MVVGIYPRGNNRVEISVDVPASADAKAAILAFMNTMGEQEAYEFIRKECPSWFQGVTA